MNEVDMTTACLGLGSNIGDRLGYLAGAARLLDEYSGITVLSISPVYESAPVGGPEQAYYLNAALTVNTSLSAHDLLRACHAIESVLGRERTVENGPRRIDIDIELFGNTVLDCDELTIPHPRMHERRFVLEPLADIAPDIQHPVIGKTVSELLKDLDEADIVKFDGAIRL